MLEILNIYAHGCVAIPVILACKKRGLFNLRPLNQAIEFSEIANALQANKGHLRVALRLLETVSWLEQIEPDRYVFLPESEDHRQIPEDVLCLMDFDFDHYLQGEPDAGQLKPWFDRSALHWGIDNSMIVDFLDGLLILPLLLSLDKGKYLHADSSAPFLAALSPSVQSEITEFFFAKNWLVESEESWKLNDGGRYMADKVWNVATVLSYRPMLSALDSVIFGDCSAVFAIDEFNNERHVERPLNVIGNGLQHRRFLADMQKNLLPLFDTQDFASQPVYIADMGCGDGSMLKKIHEFVTTQTRRGQVLDQYPLTLIGADYNEKELLQARITLDGCNFITIKADIGDPAQFIADLATLGVLDPENILHVRTFLDHDRPYNPPNDTPPDLTRSTIQKDAVYVDRAGAEIPPAVVYQSWVEHFGRWHQVIGKHGLLALEVHTLKVKTARRHIGSGSLGFDAYHGFSGQMLLSAEAFVMAAAAAGLFPRDDTAKKYPKMLAFARVTMNHFERRSYCIRTARLSDLPAVWKLEQSCWAAPLQTAITTLESRIVNNPDGQLVLELNGNVVGVLFTQRIVSKDVIRGKSKDNIDTCHQSDGTIVQLLSISVLPQVQDLNLGDELLEFGLKRATLIDDVHAVVGITRPRHYRNHSHLSFEHYVQLKNEHGWFVDPILRFHQLHGAEITEVMHNYRPADLANHGYGVLVEYNLHNRTRPKGFTEGSGVVDSALPLALNVNTDPAKAPRFSESEISDKVFQSIAILMGEEHEILYSQPLMEMGLDSADLLELNHQLGRAFDLRLAPTFFFEYGTCGKVIEYIKANIGTKESHPEPWSDEQDSAAGPASTPKLFGPARFSEGEISYKVFHCISRLLGEEKEILYSQPLMEMGLDSADLLELNQQLGRAFDLVLAPTFFFEYGTCGKVVDYIKAQLGVREPAPVVPIGPIVNRIPPRPPGQQYRQSSDSATSDVAFEENAPALSDECEIAIVGMSCRLPGGGPEGFWQLLQQGVDGVRAVPENRWWWPATDAQARRFEMAGYLDEIDTFDARFFRISAAEAELIDPQQRILLELTWELFEDAGHDPELMRSSNTGVWIGACHFDYRDMVVQADALSAHTATGTSGAILPNRLSYFFDFKGPSLMIDTACSSSLVALHDAVQSLRRGECEQAVVGGVNLICSPSNTRAYARAGMLSPTGRCHTFDRSADGYIRGEGAGLVLLKPLAQALLDGDHIYGIVAGSAVNHGGEASSLTAPNPKAQTDVISRAYQDARLSPAAVDYVEAHGTGTPLGDPIELVALTNAFDNLLAQSSRKPATDWVCHIGSVKSNIGHLEGAAGIAGLIKILLSLRHNALPGNLHFESLNPHIQLQGSPFRMVTSTRPWLRRPTLEPRCAGVSSFGFGGVSGHALVREYIDLRTPLPAARTPQIIVLSARTDAQLRQSCLRLLAFLQPPENAPAATVRLEDLAWTLQCGRAAMEGRLALVVDSIDDLCSKLQRFLAGEKDDRIHFVSAGVARLDDPIVSGEEGQDYLRAVLERGEFGRVARLWASGAAINWATLGKGAKPMRISLPTYPFARERYWVPLKQQADDSATALRFAQARNWVHPLLHCNTSDFLVQRFTTTLSGDEFFLAAHVLQGKRILPGVVYLEMARAAVANAVGIEDGDTIYLKDTVWLRPIVVEDDAVEVQIALSFNGDGEIGFEIYRIDGQSGDIIVYSQGRAGVLDAGAGTPSVNVEEIRSRCETNHIAADALYARFKGAGFEYGAALQALTDVWYGQAGAVTKLVLPPVVAADAAAYMLHPSLMDASVQGSTVALNLLANGHEFAMPYAVERLEAYHPCTASMWALCNRSTQAGSAVEKLDIDLCDDAGRVCVRIRGLSVRATDLASRDATTMLWQRGWRESVVNAGLPQPKYEQKLVLLFEAGEIAASAVEQLGATRCVGMALPASTALAERYQGYALKLWSELHALLEKTPGAPMLVQVVVPASGDAAVLGALAGLLKTVRIEHPRLIAQVIQIEAGETAQTVVQKLAECAATPQAIQLRYQQGKLLEEAWEELPQPSSAASVPWREKGVYLITGGLGGLGLIFATEIMQQAPGGVLILTGRTAIDEAKRLQLAQLAVAGTRIEYRQVDVANPAQVKALLLDIRQQFGALHGIIHGAGVIRDGLLASKKAPQLDQVFAPKVAGLINLDTGSGDLDLDWIVCFGSTSGALGNVGQADYAAANAFMDRYANYRNEARAGYGRHRIVSIDWPLWQSGGMQVDASAQRRLRRHGIHVLPTRAGLDAFYQALASGNDQVLVIRGVPERLRQSMALGGIGAIEQAGAVTAANAAQSLPTLQESNDATSSGAHAASQDQMEAMRDALLKMLRRMVSRLLKTPAENLDDELELGQYGLDSISLTELTALLNNRLGIALSPTFFFEHQTLRAVLERLSADYGPIIAKALGVASSGRANTATNIAPNTGTNSAATIDTPDSASNWRAAARTHESTQERLKRMRGAIAPQLFLPAAASKTDEPVAIIGLSGRYPQARDLDAFWQNLRAGLDCVTEVPVTRWDWREHYSTDRTEEGRHYSKWGGFIEGMDEFDPLFFNISPREARNIDPQERLFLQHAWMAMEDAGYTRSGLQVAHEGDIAGQVGVYAGVMYSEYQLFAAEAAMAGASLPIFGSLASIANRVSYTMNLHGPSMTLDTMCSSSLTAIHIACQDLRQGRTDMAIAGGVNVSVHPQKYLMLSSGQFISSDGHCQSFGEGGDGYIPGEGVGIVILKRLSEARRDGDRIYGVILGSGLNHGGKANGYTVPNPQAQGSVISRTLAEAKVNPRHISYVEAHGTGTKLGDPIEIAALTKAFGQHTSDKGYCRLGSAKSNIGHCESAAGIAGLMKVLLQMRYGEIVPSLHSAKLNPHIDFDNTPFTVNQSLTAWTRPVIDGKEIDRIASLSSFGAGGSNAHMIVQEYRETGVSAQSGMQADAAAPAVIVLSARTAAQLRQKAADLLAWFEKSDELATNQADSTAHANPDSMVTLAAVAYTLQVGRETMDERLGLLVDSLAQLRQRLQAFLQDEADIEDLYRGQAKRNREGMSLISSDEDMREAIDKWIVRRKYGKLLDLWVQGLDVDWNKLYVGAAKPQRLGLPTYPFARDKYWVEVPSVAGRNQRGMLHPLLHVNTSSLNEHSYGSQFDGREFFLADHHVRLGSQGRSPVLPALAYLEMAREAVRQALPQAASGRAMELRQMVWAAPVAIDKRQVRIALRASPNNDGTIEYEVFSVAGDGAEQIHCQGSASATSATSATVMPRPLALAQLEQSMHNGLLSGEALYERLWQMGLEYGPALRSVEALVCGDAQVLARLHLPPAAQADAQAFVLHPSLLDGALQACIGLMLMQSGAAMQTPLVYSLESVRILASCTPRMLAWVRVVTDQDQRSVAFDIDLCDPSGHVCVQISRLRHQWLTLDEAVPAPVSRVQATAPAAVAATVTAAAHATAYATVPAQVAQSSHASTKRLPAPIRLALGFTASFASSSSSSAADGQASAALLAPAILLKKTGAIALTEPATVAANSKAFSTKGAARLPQSFVRLADPGANPLATGLLSIEAVSLFDHGNGVFSICVASAGGENTASLEVQQQLLHALARIKAEPLAKVVMLLGTESVFLRGDESCFDDAAKLGLYEAIAAFPLPLIAVMQGDASGLGLLLATLCDFMIGSTDAQYGFMPAAGTTTATSSAAQYRFLAERFGAFRAIDWLYLSKPMAGAEWQSRHCPFPVLPPEGVKAFAEELALRLAEKPLDALQLLKHHLGRDLIALAGDLVAAPTPQPAMAQSGDWQPLPGVYLSCRAEPLPGRTDQALWITLNASANRAASADASHATDRLEELCTLLAQVSASGSYACVVLASELDGFLPDSGHDSGYNSGLILRLREQLLAQTTPVIAVLDTSAHGLAWFVAQHCDACVYAAEAVYTVDATGLPWREAGFAAMSAAAFSHHLGATLANELLFTNAALTGASLQSQNRTLTVAGRTDLAAAALGLAAAWAGVPGATLACWRQPLALPLHAQLASVADDANVVTVAGVIALKSGVVTATAFEQGILVVRMEDRLAKNMFSTELMDGMNEVFAHIAATPGYKAVILTGYGNYFSSGGTKENLLAIQAGEVRFTDNKIFELALRCPIPVIAAMQGHGIGAGWALGMFADFPLLSERSEYVSPYMNYGFTPGAGATLVFPQRVGYDLARETLLTARQYAGRELRERGIALPVLKQDQVLPEAMVLAQKIASLPRAMLIEIKTQLAEPMRLALEETYRLELDMHAKTFVGRADTLHLITQRFAQMAGATLPATAATPTTAPPPRMQRAPIAPIAPIAAAIPARESITTLTPISAAGSTFGSTAAQSGSAANVGATDSVAILATLKTLLAQELEMPEEEIDHGILFVDLGLDSVGGVTWVRKINERYGTTIEATQIYSHPTLTQLSVHLAQVLRTRTGKPEDTGRSPTSAPASVGIQPSVGIPATSGDAPLSWGRTVEPPQINAGANNTASAAAILAELKLLLGQELQIPTEDIDNGIQFVDLGLDSVGGVTWVRKINERYGTTIEATQIYSHPTLTQLSVHVLQVIRKNAGEPENRSGGFGNASASDPGSVMAAADSAVPSWQPRHNTAQRVAAESAPLPGLPLKSRRDGSAIPSPVPAAIQAPPQPTVQAPVQAAAQSPIQPVVQPAVRLSPLLQHEPIAVIGMAGQFPQALDVDEFWNNIAAGKDCIIEVPPERWDMDAYYQAGAAAPGKTNSRWMGALEEYDRFDPLFFNISPTEAESMDPQQRLFLQTCWNAIEHAGYDARTLSGSNCGVFVGCGESDYHKGSAEQRLSAQGFTGSSNSILAARISYFLNLQGPCLAIDTACSSSLVAIAHACDSLNSGNTSLALAGGVYIMAGPEMHIKASQTGMLSAQGRCFSFDQRANGFVPGEAVATVMLKRLSDAERDGDTICAVIRGWGVNQDGKTNGITAPNPEAQSNLQCDVYQRWQIDPANIGLIEAHGTGTKLGDPIEVLALKNSFAKYTRNENYCALGSVKSNIGHCLTAAGATGFIKLVQALRHRQLPPTIQFETLNEHIVLDGSPFYVNDRLRPWEVQRGQPRQAAISSFGFSGTNAHLVLEEYREPTEPRPAVQVLTQDGKMIVPLSAKTAEQLHQRAAALLAMLEGPGRVSRPLNLLELAYTLQAGRVAMDERVAFVVDSIDALAQKLRQFGQGAAALDGTFSGQVGANRGQISLITQDSDVTESLISIHLAKRQLGKLAQLWSKGLELDWNRFYGDAKPHRVELPVYPFAKERYWNADVADPFGHTMGDEKRAFLHPLVQVNVSDFTMQRYSATFTGDEAFLHDHRVRTPDGTIQKVLPGVAFLEMARMAIANALRDESSMPELCDTAWLRPVVVNAPKQVFIALEPGAGAEQDDQIVFRIYSQEQGEEVLHCQGRAVFRSHPPLARVDVAALKAQLGAGGRESGEVYAAFNARGLIYGPAHRGIAMLQADPDQVLARLQLPPATFGAQESGAPYFLHPGMMDSALQAQLGLSTDWQTWPDNPVVPFALDSLRMVAPCSERMVAWLRRSPGSAFNDLATKVDIDLCNDDGEVCVRMRGFTCRALGNDVRDSQARPASATQGGVLLADGDLPDGEFDGEFYEELIEQILTQDMSIDAAVKLG